MTIPKESIPEELRPDKNISPYIQRAVELDTTEPIISYYNKIYVLEYILNNKLHTRSKANEEFTIKLLDDTESTKKDTADENLHTVLNDKNLSFRYVLKFAYGLFNSCLESLKSYRVDQKSQTIAKFRASMCFLNVLNVFESSKDSIDFAGIFGPKVKDWNDFNALNKEKLKVLKYQLTRLIKDDVHPEEELESSNADLEQELEEELNKLSTDQFEEENAKETTNVDIKDEEVEESKNTGSNLNAASNNFPKSASDEFEQDDAVEHKPAEPGADINNSNNEAEEINLPGAPHFIPDENSDSDNVKLPQPPKFLPSDDITHINKSGSIHVFPPGSNTGNTNQKSEVAKSTSINAARSQHHEKPLSKENIKEMLNRDDAVVQIQKHTKFANSALQFEDFNEAENQLLKGLELLRALKRQEGE